MAFVLSSVLPMYFTTPVQFKGHPAQARLKNLRAACDWPSYAQEAAQQRSMSTQVSLFQWCLPGAGGGTVFSFASLEIEALVAHYNVLAGVCVDLVAGVRAHDPGRLDRQQALLQRRPHGLPPRRTPKRKGQGV